MFNTEQGSQFTSAAESTSLFGGDNFFPDDIDHLRDLDADRSKRPNCIGSVN
jgi:hypothetical protein